MSQLHDALSDALADRYRIERELGHGGMATVYLAQDLKHDRQVALKVLRPELAYALGPERFQREIRLAARLQHPHILTVHDSGEAAGRLWYTMPLVEGESLRDRLRRVTQLPVDEALRIAGEVARALDYAHRAGVVHRDIKPENILLTRDGDTLVADFGIARTLDGDQGLTETGIAVGTPAYMSPEQAAGDRALDARTDVYALGTVLYEMLAGEPPFTGPTAQAIVAKRLSGEIPSVRLLRPSVPVGVERAIVRALAPVAADRFGGADEFARALVAGPAATAAPRSLRRIPAGAALLALGFLLGLGLLFAWRQSHPGSDAAEPVVGTPLMAVLPFENLGVRDDEYFADGITDEVRGKLAALGGVRVIAGGSSKEYKGTTKTLAQIGRELGASYLLVASVRWTKASDGSRRVRVSPELVQVAGGTPTTRWQEPFDAALTDVFQVQADIAGRVAQSLGVALGDSARRRLGGQPTASLAAYDAFLRGEEVSDGMAANDPVTLRRAASHYERAAALDPGYAPAWARLSLVHSTIYGNGVPTAEGAEAARRSGERALALAPGSADGRKAMGLYFRIVAHDFARAATEYDAALRLAPDDADLLSASAANEQNLGRWDAALAHLQRAAALDPRSPVVARRLGYTLRYLRRYPESMAALDRGLAVAPTNLNILEQRAMAHLAQGDLESARTSLRSAPREVDPTALVTYLALYYDLFWVLDDEQQQLLLRMRPEQFDEDRGAWGLVLAQTLLLRGDSSGARIYADSARIAFEAQVREAPQDPQRHVALGLALAILGRKAEAIREGERGVGLQPVAKDAIDGPYFQHQLVRVYLLVGEPGRALDRLEPLLGLPYDLSPGWLRIDPNFQALRGNPRFERLVKGS